MTVVNMAKQEESTDIDINNYSEEPWSLIEFNHRVKMNTLAAQGKWSKELEN